MIAFGFGKKCQAASIRLQPGVVNGVYKILQHVMWPEHTSICLSMYGMAAFRGHSNH